MFDLIPNRNFPSTVFQIKLMMLCVDSFFFYSNAKKHFFFYSPFNPKLLNCFC